ncbi:MAG: hypothetical protein NC250_03160 [Alistipes senegalensis]|nr:hypothetical protein [Bacteroides cellulosilyticus]MCM1351717.1 hypothetical protein [Alistipes senegalensis]
MERNRNEKPSKPIPDRGVREIPPRSFLYRECKYTNNSAKSKSFAENGAYIFRIRTKDVPLPTQRFRTAPTELREGHERNRNPLKQNPALGSDRDSTFRNPVAGQKRKEIRPNADTV